MTTKEYSVGVDSGQMAFVPIESITGSEWCSGPELDLGGPGEYDCWADLIDSGSWGIRVATLKLGKKGDLYLGKLITPSGRIIVSDPCYVHGDDTNYDNACYATLGHSIKDGPPWPEIKERIHGGEYEVVDRHGEEVIGKGVVSESGYGDGGYPCFVTFGENDVVKKIEVKFISDE